jgi:hypothetical protein
MARADWPQYWKKNMPDALESGRVEIKGSFFFFVLLSWN